MPRIHHIRVRHGRVKVSKYGILAKPSTNGGALKKHLKENDEYHTNLGMLKHSLKSLNISGPKRRSKYIEF
jgi:prenyltransferase beta subunit